ncbi:Sec-independent protein translocase TatB [Agromyces allii]|uniref:Sec-independent protein translocase protein TatB n=1 Tax=Agromyces allii TaxID=393607 RepID=A0ABN2Q180_9MICO|nr:Sec-independent protein translocase TatB [Agromyces allii]
MTFGLTFEKLLLIGIIAAVLVGPTRLPAYATALAGFVKKVRAFATTTTAQVRDELGPEFSDEDWRALDPRRYDPRSIMRAALTDDAEPGRPAVSASRPGPGAAEAPSASDAARPEPTEPEAPEHDPGLDPAYAPQAGSAGGVTGGAGGTAG